MYSWWERLLGGGCIISTVILMFVLVACLVALGIRFLQWLF